MHPEIHEGLTGLHSERTLGLGNLIFVVRKLEIGATAVDIKMLTQKCATHCRTFNMPAWPALSPWRGPTNILGLIGLGLLP